MVVTQSLDGIQPDLTSLITSLTSNRFSQVIPKSNIALETLNIALSKETFGLIFSSDTDQSKSSYKVANRS